MTRKRKVFQRPKAEINITPLIDVMLVLLVIFMVITPQTPQGLEANVPQAAPPGPQHQPERTLILSMARDGSIRLNHESVEPQDVAVRLQEVFKTRSDRTLFVQADNDLPYDDVVHLIDSARGAGATRVGLMSDSVKVGK
jgi:biopolymer transport protein TolR